MGIIHPFSFIRKAVLLLASTFVLSTMAFAQNGRRQVTGTVVDSSGETLPGVTVYVKGNDKGQAARGASTNNEGAFVISASPNETLVFSCISYKAREVPASYFDKELTIALEDDNESLSEAVVVGYGVQKKVSVVGAISTVNMMEVKAMPTSNLSAALAGKVPGLIANQVSGEPGSDMAQLYVRGLSTWGDNSPIVIVDGIERDINLLTTTEIESISFLKDATATSIYGIRGANGVIVITTKHGQAGAPKVTFRSEYAMLTGQRFPDFISAGEYSELWNEACRNDGVTPTWSAEDILRFYDHSDPYNYPDVNWMMEIFKKRTFQTQQNLTVSGGTDRVHYFINFGYMKQNGLFKSDPSFDYSTNVDLARYNLRSNIDIQIARSLTAEVGLGIISQDYRHPSASTSQIMSAVYDFAPNKIPIRNPDGSFCATIFNTYTNPYMQATHRGYSTMVNNQFQGTFALKWDLSSLVTKGLQWNNTFSFDQYGVASNSRVKSVTSKQFVGINAAGDDDYKIWFEKTPEAFSASGSGNRALRYYSQLNYDRAFGDHNLSGMLLYNMGESVNVTAGSGTAALPSRIMGVSGRAVYDFGHRYIAEFSFGYNGSENFAPGHRFGFFPGIALGWNLAKEPYWKWNSISTFKLRGSVGTVGNDRTGGSRFAYLSTTGSASGFLMGVTQGSTAGYTEGSIGAGEDITWEKARKINLGFDYGMYDDKLTVGIDAFHEKRDGLLIQRSNSIPLASGLQASQLPFVNKGKSQNKGIEGSFEAKNTTAGGFFYSLRANISFSQSKCIDRDEPANQPDYQSYRGHSLALSLAYVADGFFEDEQDIATSPKQTWGAVRPGDAKYRDINGDGLVDAQDRVMVGYPQIPELNYGFGFTMSYKGFDWSLFFQGAARSTYFFYGLSIYPFVYGQESNVQREFYEYRWKPGADNSEARYPRVSTSQNDNNNQISTLYMRDGSYLRLKNVEIGYSLPGKLMDKVNIAGCRLFVNGVDLLLFDKLKIADPQTNGGNISYYPKQSTVNAGVEITF
ncbi:MAG: TonB-dependent receptor [Bacteroidales bacterium]|nr:TonB-dependent receptor [Bacteroidales bacterium]